MTEKELGYKMVLRQLEAKEFLLKKILAAPAPKIDNEILQEKYERKLEKLHIYLDELKEIQTCVAIGLDVHIVSMDMMKRREAKSDFAELTFDGEYCKLMRIHSFPWKSAWLLWVASPTTI